MIREDYVKPNMGVGEEFYVISSVFSPIIVWMHPPRKRTATEIIDPYTKKLVNNFPTTFMPMVKSHLRVDYFTILF
jgi:hypothetical protein